MWKISKIGKLQETEKEYFNKQKILLARQNLLKDTRLI